MTALQTTKRLIVALMGGTVLLVGLALIVLPGPALLVIPAGLAILALEFAWARRWLRKARGLLPTSKPRRKLETASSAPVTQCDRDRAAASCRKAIPLPSTEITHQLKTKSNKS